MTCQDIFLTLCEKNVTRCETYGIIELTKTLGGEEHIMELKERIKMKRKENRMTLDAVAEASGVTKSTIYKYENGIVTNIPSNRLEALAKALHTTPGYLMGWEEDSRTTDKYIDATEKMKAALSSTEYFDREFSDDEIKMIVKYAKFLQSGE